MIKAAIPSLSCVLLSGVASVSLAGNIFTVKVPDPGSLERSFGTTDPYTVESLRIEGTLDNDDIRFLRTLLGSDSLLNQLPSNLRSLDLSEARFENSGAKGYAKVGDGWFHVVSPSRLPAVLVYKSPLEKIVLPSAVDSIDQFSISNCNVRELDLSGMKYVHPRAVMGDTLLHTLRLPAMADAITPTSSVLKSIRSITYGDVDYVPAQSFNNLPELEEIIFGGLVGHIDGYTVNNCPKLKKIIFSGPVNTTGGSQFTSNCPALENISIGGLALWFGNVANPGNTKDNLYRISGAVMESGDSSAVPVAGRKEILARPDMVDDLKRLARWEISHLTSAEGGFLRRMAYATASEQTDTMLVEAGLISLSDSIREAMRYAKGTDDFKTKLQILKEAPAYIAGSNPDIGFSYASPTDSMLRLTREYFNLDSVAGNGDDISRMKRLLYWVHDLVRHDGGSSWPDCPFNLRDLYKVAQQTGRGYNCRFMAMMLTEALLAEGFKARYLTCMPKAWDMDDDCHVICVAWSDSLNKWVWLDPTFAAYVTDENGLLLHPGEVRERLRTDLPLILNQDANWNHKSPQTKEEYLDSYMAKNLYIITSNSRNQAEPEGGNRSYHHEMGKEIYLAPPGARLPSGAAMKSSDPEWFWQKP